MVFLFGEEHMSARLVSPAHFEPIRMKERDGVTGDAAQLETAPPPHALNHRDKRDRTRLVANALPLIRFQVVGISLILEVRVGDF